MSDCPHLVLHPHVQNLRVTEVDGEPALHWLLVLTVRCTQCGCRFQFRGLPAGVSVEAPSADETGYQAHLPIVPVERGEQAVN